MSVIDIIVLFFVSVFLILDGLRGFIKSVGSLAGFILGFWIAGRFAYIGANYLKSNLHPILAYVTSFVFIFILVFAACHFFSFVLKSILKEKMLKSLDHILGMCIGIAKGFFLATILFMLINIFYPLPSKWKEKSFTYPYLYKLSRVIINHIPQKMKLTKPEKSQLQHGRFI